MSTQNKTDTSRLPPLPEGWSWHLVAGGWTRAYATSGSIVVDRYDDGELHIHPLQAAVPDEVVQAIDKARELGPWRYRTEVVSMTTTSSCGVLSKCQQYEDQLEIAFRSRGIGSQIWRSYPNPIAVLSSSSSNQGGVPCDTGTYTVINGVPVPKGSWVATLSDPNTVARLSSRCTGDLDTCPDDECLVCGARECPHGEPMHFHHDGCPACAELGDDPTWVGLNRSALGENDTVDPFFETSRVVSFQVRYGSHWMEAVSLILPKPGAYRLGGASLPPHQDYLLDFADAWTRCRKFITDNNLEPE